MMSLRMTDGVACLLDEVASCSGVPEAVKSDALNLRGEDTIPWEQVKSIVSEFRKASPGKSIYLHQLLSHKDVLLPAPPPKKKSPELVARLARLQAELDNKRYSEMVADITEKERKAEELRNSILPTSRLQLSFGAHVLVTMFTFWAVAYYGSKFYLSYDELWAGLAGAMGMTTGLMVETLLLIIRSNRPTPLEERMPELFDKAKVQEAYARSRELKQAQANKGKKQLKSGAASKQRQDTAPEGQSGATSTESKKAR